MDFFSDEGLIWVDSHNLMVIGHFCVVIVG